MRHALAYTLSLGCPNENMQFYERNYDQFQQLIKTASELVSKFLREIVLLPWATLMQECYAKTLRV